MLNVYNSVSSIIMYSNWMDGWLVRVRIPVGARFSAPIQIGPGAHTVLYNRYRVSFMGENGWGVALTTHPHQVLRLRNE
jgi:hypothetical protein